MNNIRPALAGLALLVCVVATGCGGNGSVSGKVSYNGQALGGGTVIFYSEGKGSAESQIGPDGSYSIDKIAAGPVKVAVETASAKPVAPDPRRPAMPTPPPDQTPKGADTSLYNASSAPKGKYVAIPETYGNPATSGLTYDVKAGSQQKDFDLK